MVNVPGYALYFTTSGQLTFGIDDDSAFQPEDAAQYGTDIYDGTWHHFVARKSNTSRIDLFVDGKLVASDTTIAATGSLANSNTLYIGDRNGANDGDEFNGDIDNVKVYRAFLTEEQVRIDMNAGASTNYGTTASLEATQLTDGAGNPPVGEWRLDSNTGTTAVDTSGNENTGTITIGNGGWVPGKFGSAFDVDNSTGKVLITDPASGILDFGASSDFSISGWFSRASATTDDSIVQKRNSTVTSAGNVGYTIYLSDGGDNLFFILDDGTDVFFMNSSSSFLNSNWNHFTVVWDDDSATNTRVYINGVNVTASQTGTIGLIDSLSNALNFAIGSQPNGSNPLHGKVDQVRVFNYALTPAQVAYDYNRGGPIAHWKMDECQGSTINDGSGNGLNGTLTVGASGTQTSAGTCNTASTAWGNGATGKYNSSLHFDGTDDYVDMGDMPLTESVSQLSWGIWLRPTSISGLKCLLCKFNNGNTQTAWYTQTNTSVFGLNNSILAGIGTTTTDGNTYAVTPANTISTGTWTHVAVVFDGTLSGNANRFKIYINGIQQTLTFSGTFPATTQATTSNARIGSTSDGNRYFNGQLDDARIYNYAVSATQVQKIYNDGAGVRFGPATGSP